MTVYIGIFAAFSMLAILGFWKNSQNTVIYSVATVIFLSWFIGYRFEIGVDWVTYEIIYLDISRMNLWSALAYGDSAYSLINWIVSRVGGQVWHVNLVCAVIFSAGLVRLCEVLPRPGLGIAIAIPTLVIITAMGYTRQAAAIGCIMFAFARFRGTIDLRWLSWLVLAALFHKSALILLPLFVMSGSQQRWITIAMGSVIGAALLSTVVLSNFSDIMSLYFESDIDSSGAAPRIALNALVGATYFLIRDKVSVFEDRQILVRNLAITMCLLAPAFFIIPSTTVVDRVGILLVPFQSVILVGLAFSLRNHPIAEGMMRSAILASYGASLVVWLVFSSFADYWVPYENVSFMKWV